MRYSQAADALVTYGALLLHDSRVSEEDNNTFLDLIEDYFAQAEEALKKDERPELGYQASPLANLWTTQPQLEHRLA